MFVFMYLALDLNPKSIVYLDTSCKVIFDNKNWFWKYQPGQKISIMSTFLKFKSLRASKYKSAEFAMLFLYFLNRDNDRQQVYTLLKYEIH